MKYAIVGSREYNDLGQVREWVQMMEENDVLVSGGAKGVDGAAMNEAEKMGISQLIFYPDYKKYGSRRAPIARNIEIVDNCDEVIAFWDGESKGTHFTIDYAKKTNKTVTVIMGACIARYAHE